MLQHFISRPSSSRLSEPSVYGPSMGAPEDRQGGGYDDANDLMANRDQVKIKILLHYFIYCQKPRTKKFLVWIGICLFELLTTYSSPDWEVARPDEGQTWPDDGRDCQYCGRQSVRPHSGTIVSPTVPQKGQITSISKLYKTMHTLGGTPVIGHHFSRRRSFTHINTYDIPVDREGPLTRTTCFYFFD